MVWENGQPLMVISSEGRRKDKVVRSRGRPKEHLGDGAVHGGQSGRGRSGIKMLSV